MLCGAFSKGAVWRYRLTLMRGPQLSNVDIATRKTDGNTAGFCCEPG